MIATPCARRERIAAWRRWGVLSVVVLVAAACGNDPGGEDRGRDTAPAADAATGDDAETGADAVASDDGDPAAGEWPHAGLDLGNSRAAVGEAAVGPDNVASLRPAWQLDGVRGVTSTPIVLDAVAYLGDWTGHVRALAADTGEELWATDLDTQYIGGAVAVDDQRVFAGSLGSRFAALDRATGELLWDQDLHDNQFTAIFGSPVHVDGLVIVGVASFENMVQEDDYSFRGAVVALDAETGDEVWRYWTSDEGEGPGVSVWSSPAVDTERGLLYIGTGQHYAEPTTGRSDAVIALEVESGEERWVRQYTEGDVWTLRGEGGEDADVGAQPNLFEVAGTDAVGAGDKAGTYKALDRDTGAELWSVDLTEGSIQGGIMASAAVHDGQIFVASNNVGGPADLVALDADSGEEVWRSDVGGSVTGPVTWANGIVYVADNGRRISGFAADTGERLWTHEVDADAAGGISVVDGTVYAGHGWWLLGPPDDPQGGMTAFRVDGPRGGEAGGLGG